MKRGDVNILPHVVKHNLNKNMRKYSIAALLLYQMKD